MAIIFIILLNFTGSYLLFNTYLLHNKNELVKRKMRKFNENNWFEFGFIRFKTGLFFEISVLSILGFIISWYILRYFKYLRRKLSIVVLELLKY